MSTLRVSNIEAKADVSSPSVNEKVKVTNSNGELLVHIDGATLGITTVGINTSGESVRFDSNQNVTFFGDITGTGLDINGNADISGNLNVGGVLTYEDVTNIDSVGVITARSGINVTGGQLNVAGNMQFTAADPELEFNNGGPRFRVPAANTLTIHTGGGLGATTNERLRIDSSGRVSINDNSRPASDANEGAQLRVTGAPLTRNQYYSPAGHYYGSFGYTDNTNTKSWIAVDSSYAKSSAISAGIFLSAFHQDTGGSDCGFTIKNLKDGNSLVISSVATAASVSNPAVETERLRINSDGTIRLKSDGTAANKARFEINEKWNNNATDFGIDFKRTYDVGGDDQDAGFIHVKRNGGSSQIGMSFGIGNKDDVSERACLTSAGDLGIGVTPDADRRLHVKDVNAVVKIEGTTSYAQVEFKTGSTSSAWIWRNQQSVTSYGGASSLNFYQTENAGFAFFTNAVSSPAMLIAGNGMVTKPKNPSFAVTRNVSTWSMSTNTIFDYNTKIHDVGNNFSTSTHKFTCPVAGTYQFNFYSIYYATALANAAVYIRKNNTRISGGDQHFSVDFSTARWHNVSYSISLLCAANDTVHVENGSVGVTYHGGFWHRFSGHLIG